MTSGAEARQRLVPDDEVILVARVTPAGLKVTSHVEPRPENEYILQVRTDGVIVGSDSRSVQVTGQTGPRKVREAGEVRVRKGGGVSVTSRG